MSDDYDLDQVDLSADAKVNAWILRAYRSTGYVDSGHKHLRGCPDARVEHAVGDPWSGCGEGTCQWGELSCQITCPHGFRRPYAYYNGADLSDILAEIDKES